MRFGLIANLKRQGAKEAITAFINWSRTSGQSLILCDELKDISQNNITLLPRDKIADAVDIMVSMGGDGTLLSVARLVGPLETPVLGINLGSLGFLTQLSPKQLIEALDAIVAGDYQTENRMLLKAALIGDREVESPFALNDVVVNNGPISRLIDINLRVNGEDVVTYRADGLIIATPTGSTAYAMAVGGPIMHPKMEAIIVAPVSSFSLSARPMIFSSDVQIEIEVRSEHGHAGLTLDGQIMLPLNDSDRVIIKRADFSTRLIVFSENRYYHLLKTKLHWGIRPIAE